MTDFTLTDLERIIAARTDEAAETSYTASLLHKGPLKCAEKFGEEAVELILALAAQDDKAVTDEAADLLYHLMVALKARNVPLSAVLETLQGRTAQSGHAEKAARG